MNASFDRCESDGVCTATLASFPPGSVRLVLAQPLPYSDGELTFRFPLVFAGQAWHWVKPEVGLPKAHDVLLPGGVLAPFWNRVA